MPVSFTFPTGIAHELLASVHIPSDTYIAVEAEAERLVGLNADGDDTMYSSISSSSLDSTAVGEDGLVQGCTVKSCVTGYVWDPDRCECVVAEEPSPTTATQTIGNLSVADTQLGTQNLRNVRVVARRWFKIERMYTNINGRFNSTKKFKNKVKLIVKFKNNDFSIRGVRGVRVYQVVLPIQKKFGPLQGSEINNFTYNLHPAR